MNAFGAATWYSVNLGCGAPVSDIDGFFSSLPEGSLVRVWAFQALGWNNKASVHHLDFTGIDRVVEAANRHNQKLILTLSDQAGTCDDGHWHDRAWYDGGYASRYDDYGYGNGDRSYLDWVRTIVLRYATATAVAVWEPVNEPEASDCSGATGSACWGRQVCQGDSEGALLRFFDTIGAEIHRLDPTSVVSSGVIGRKQCGVNGGGFVRIAHSPQVDLMTYHDYSGADETLPPDLADRLPQAAEAGKPLLIEEAGLQSGGTCLSAPDRARSFAAKLRTALDHGAAGYLLWNYEEHPAGGCTMVVPAGDPSLQALRSGRSAKG